MGIVKGIIQDMGLTINESKTEMGQELVLLGVALSTIANKGKKCTAALTEKRRLLIASKCATKDPFEFLYSNLSWDFWFLHHKSSLAADCI